MAWFRFKGLGFRVEKFPESRNPVPSLEAYLLEAHRVLKPGGVRLTCVWKVGQLTRFRVQKFRAYRVELMKACSSGLAVGRRIYGLGSRVYD